MQSSCGLRWSKVLSFVLSGVTLWLCLSLGAHASTTEYSYDMQGRLVQAIRSDGIVIQYQYDETGNVLAINRFGSSTVSVAGTSSKLGHVGASVTIFGTGFSTAPSENLVAFGGASTTPASATSTELVVTVPEGATTGPITVAVNGVSASSADSYIIRVPQIISFSPAITQAGGVVTVLGSNLNLVPGGTSIKVGDTTVTSTYVHNSKVTFTAPASGSGIVRVVTPYGVGESATSLLISPPSIPLANIETVRSISPMSGEQTLTVTQANKVGMLKFEAVQDQLLSVQLGAMTTSPANGGVTLSVYSTTNAVLVLNAGVSYAQKTFHLPRIPKTGTYLIAFKYNGGTFSLTANLELDGQLQVSGVPLHQSTPEAAHTKRVWFTANAGDDLGLAITNLVHVPVGGITNMVVRRPDNVAITAWLSCNPSTRPGCTFRLPVAPQTGIYTISAEPSAAVAIDFTLTLTKAVSGTLTPNSPMTVNMASPGQYGVLTFSANEGQTFAVSANASAVTADQLVQLHVFNAAGVEQGWGDRGTQNLIVNLPNLAAGTYSVVLYAEQGATATAEVTLVSGVTGVLPTDGSSHTFTTATKGQHAYFTFNGVAGQNIGFALTNFAALPQTTFGSVTIIRPNGAWHQLSCSAPAHGVQGCQIELRNLSVTGSYRIDVGPYGLAPQSSVTMSFTLTVSQHQLGTLSLNTPEAVNLGVPGKYGLFAFNATTGQTVAVNASAIDTTPNDKNISITVTAPDGTTYVGTGAEVANINLTNLAGGTYSMLLNTEHAATATAQLLVASGLAGVLPVDGMTRSFTTNARGQAAYFTFQGAAGQNVGLAVTNFGSAPSQTWGVFDIYRPGSTWASSQVTCGSTINEQPGCQAELRNLPLTGTYKVIAYPYENYQRPPATMSFGLTLSQHISGPLTLSIPQTVNLVAGQYASLTFTKSAGQALSLTGSSLATTPMGKDVEINILNSAGASTGLYWVTTAGFTGNLSSLPAGAYSVLVNTKNAATATMQVVLQ